MPLPPRARKITQLLALTALGVLVWFWLSRPADTAAWLKVEAPRAATMGRPLILRVTTNAATPAVLTADLHWSTTRREYREMLSKGPAQPTGTAGSTLTFRLEVPPQEDMGFLRVVVYGGPTGGWDNRVEAATSDYVPVVTVAPEARGDGVLRALAMFDQKPDPVVVRLDRPAVQAIIATLWAMSAVMWWRCTRPGGRPLAFACLAAAVWEALPIEDVVGGAARAFAINHRWYADRLGIQVFMTTAVLVATVAAVAGVWSRQRAAAVRATWLGLGGYVGVSLASLLSLHKVDAILATMIVAVSLLQVVQVGAVLVAFAGSTQARNPPPPATG